MSDENVTEDTSMMLPSILNLAASESLREKFMQFIVVGNDVTLDASEVNSLTTPCLQVLISTSRTVEENGSSFLIKNPSQAVVNAFEDLGLMEIFNKWSTK